MAKNTDQPIPAQAAPEGAAHADPGADDRKPMASGVGESRRFGGNQLPTEEQKRWESATIDGNPVDPAVWGKIPWRFTDQGQAEYNAGKARPLVEVTRAAEDKSIDRFRDGRISNHLLHGKDPLQVIMDRHLDSGSSGLWMDKEVIKRQGMTRGFLEYAVVRDAEGKPVEEMGMVLAAVPVEAKEEADRLYKNLGEQKLKDEQETVQRNADEALGPHSFKDLAKRKRMLDSIGGLEVEDAEQVAAETMPHEMG